MNAPGWGSWSIDPVFALAMVGVVVIYVRMYRRARERAAKPPGAGHWIPYGFGILALIVALCSPLDAIGDKWLLSAHMLQHVLLSDIAPALLILGLRAPILPLGLSRPALLAVAPGRRTGRVLARLTSPWVAIPLWMIATWVCTRSSTRRCSTPAWRCGG
jgi:cytochrome c oxidase assembly factor CtaG